MITYDQFEAKYNGVGIDFDGAYGNQCMDLMHQYCVEVLGITDGSVLAAPTAKDVYLNFNNIKGHDLFDKIDNTPTGIPNKGDIMFWGTGLGPYGHVAIYIDGDVNGFNSFDQNFPTGSKCHKQRHNYNGVLGWLRFKGTNLEAELDKTRKERDKNWNLYQDEIKKTTDLTNQVKNLQTKIDKAKQDLT